VSRQRRAAVAGGGAPGEMASRAPAVSRRRTSSRRAALGLLSDLDHKILAVVSWLRVVTQTQLERLHPDVPERKLRYRTNRLRKLGLLGVSRPYRDTRSSPQHWWPTNAGRALASGEPPPRRGERRAPNPLTSAHNAAISDLSVVLKTQPAEAGLGLVRFDREGDAREAFETSNGREHAIAPDVTVQLSDPETGGLLAHVEIDLGTMSHARLRTKLGQYLLYTEQKVWRERFAYQPALLFITTGRQRATTFRRTARRLSGSKRWAGATKEWELGISIDAHNLERILAGTRWIDLSDDGALPLPQLLRRARAPHDRRAAAQRAAEEAREAERLRLLRDPEALCEHIREQYSLRQCLETRLNETGRISLDFLLKRSRPIDGDERGALFGLGRAISACLPAGYRAPGLDDVEPVLLADLASVYRRQHPSGRRPHESVRSPPPPPTHHAALGRRRVAQASRSRRTGVRRETSASDEGRTARPPGRVPRLPRARGTIPRPRAGADQSTPQRRRAAPRSSGRRMAALLRTLRRDAVPGRASEPTPDRLRVLPYRACTTRGRSRSYLAELGLGIRRALRSTVHP